MVKRMGGSLFAAVAGLALVLGVAFNVTNSQVQAAPEDDIAQVVADAVAAWNNRDAVKFVGLFTDDGLESNFGVTRAEAVEAIAEEMEGTGRIAIHSVTDIRTTSGNGVATVEIEFEVGFNLYEEWRFYFRDGGWKIDVSSPLYRPIPAGVPTVQLDLDEYAFIYDANAVRSGNFAFTVRNVGAEDHEVVVLRITGEGSLLEILAASEDEDAIPEGIEFVTFGGYFPVGVSNGTTVFSGPLEAGRYGLICFIPTPDGVPHAFAGMVSEFTVGAPAPSTPAPQPGVITPPATGDAGLAGSGATAHQLGLAALGTVVLLAGLAGMARVAVRH